jgi:GT2 family glycosyltransferase
MISVIIPLYNKEKSISATINSILSQTFQNFEIVVVNDGSTDKSLGIVSAIIDSRINIINQENRGVSSARNNGIKHAKYNYIALLDGDDLWESSFLQEMSSFIQAFSEADLYGCAYSFQHPDSTITIPDLGLKNHLQGYIDYFVLAKNNTLFTSSSVVFRKDAFIEVGEFDANFTKGEDIDLWIRFALHGQVAFYNKSLAIYKLDGENRAFTRPTSRDKSLIWNLNKYKVYETSNQIFKEFLDNWRLAHINNYLKGIRSEVDEIKSLLKDIDLKKYSLVWTVLKYTPVLLQPFVYKTWNNLRDLFR